MREAGPPPAASKGRCSTLLLIALAATGILFVNVIVTVSFLRRGEAAGGLLGNIPGRTHQHDQATLNRLPPGIRAALARDGNEAPEGPTISLAERIGAAVLRAEPDELLKLAGWLTATARSLSPAMGEKASAVERTIIAGAEEIERARAGAAAGAAAAAAPVVIKPSPPPAPVAPDQAEFREDDRLYTQQTCYIQSDESEICVYDNIMCFDGKSPVVTVDLPVVTPERIDDGTSACLDYRFYEPNALENDGCLYSLTGRRLHHKPPATRPRNPTLDHSLPLGRRRWGPTSRGGGLFFKEVTPQYLLGDDAEQVAKEVEIGTGWNSVRGSLEARTGRSAPGTHDPASLAGNGVGIGERPELRRWQPKVPLPEPKGVHGPATLLKSDFMHEAVPNLRVSKRFQVFNRTIDWVDDTLWYIGLDAGSGHNPFHWMSKVGMLYDAQRSNATEGGFGAHPFDRYIHWARKAQVGADWTTSRTARTHNRAAWVRGAQWQLPSMDSLIFTGAGALKMRNVSALGSWFTNSLRMSTQPHTKAFGAELTSMYNDTNLLCSRRSVMLGTKYRLFTNRADHWLFRAYAYEDAKLPEIGLQPHPRYPPPFITLTDREPGSGRSIHNLEEVLAAIKETGVPFAYVPSLSKMSFHEQVAVMSRTGILIGPHGAALANSMFLPAHAIVMELFPPLMKKLSYSTLASLSGVIHVPVYSTTVPSQMRGVANPYGLKLLKEADFKEKCVAVNMTHYESNVHHACNAAAKYLPVVVDIPVFKTKLAEAVDAISVFFARRAELTDLPPRAGPPKY